MTSSPQTLDDLCNRWLERCLAHPLTLDYRATGSALLAAATLKQGYSRANRTMPHAVTQVLCDMLVQTLWSCDNSYLFELSTSTQDLILGDRALHAAAIQSRLAHRFALVNALRFDMKAAPDLKSLYENTRVWFGDLPKKLRPGLSAVAELLVIWADDPQRREKWTFLLEAEKMFSENIPGHTKWKDSNLDVILDLAFKNLVPGSSQHALDLPSGVSFEIS